MQTSAQASSRAVASTFVAIAEDGVAESRRTCHGSDFVPLVHAARRREDPPADGGGGGGGAPAASSGSSGGGDFGQCKTCVFVLVR